MLNTIQKRQDQAMTPFTDSYDDAGPEESPLLGLLNGLVRRWRIVLITFSAICVVGIPAIWITMEPYYQATAAIRVTPVVSSILFQGENSIPMYRNFVQTQADLMVSDMVLEKVAEELIREKIIVTDEPNAAAALSGRHNHETGPVATLKAMVARGTLRVQPEDSTELIKITMKSSRPDEAAAVVNTFLKAYMSIVACEESRCEDDKRAVLEEESRELGAKLQKQRRAIGAMTREYGTASLTARQQMKLESISALQHKLTEFEMEKIALQIKEQMLVNQDSAGIAPHDLIRLRYDFINADLMVKTLTTNAAQLEQELMIAKQQLTPSNSALRRKAELVEALKDRLGQRRKEVGEDFDAMVEKESTRKGVDELAAVRAQLQQIDIYKKRLEEMLAAEDKTAIELGRKQLAIDDLQSQYEMTKDIYDTVQRRIQEIEVERKRPGRISRAYYANTAPLQDKRKKYSLALMFGAIGLGGLAGVLRDRFDLSLHTPEDLARVAAIRILGTTTRSRDVEEAFLPEHYMNDYQTICANMGLLYETGIPQKLLVTSPRSKDGKTTFAINLSVTLAKMGRKVLLIDGDLRKADVAYLLKLCGAANGLKHVLMGESPADYICHTSVDNFDLLPSNPCEASVIYNLMTPDRLRDSLDELGSQYNHIVVDTPPTLDVPDALMWSRAVDGVVLTAYSGQTRSTDVRETLFRFEQMRVPVLGVVLNNVPARQSYCTSRYYAESTSTAAPHLDGATRAHLLPMGDEYDTAGTEEDEVEYAVDCDA